MDIEYSKSGEGVAYTFDKFERKLIAESLKPYMKKYDKKILAVENDPKNEGQVTFQCKIDDLRNEKNCIKDIINQFSK